MRIELSMVGCALGAALMMSACDKGEDPRVPGSLAAAAPALQTGVVATPVDSAPAVLLKDTKGRPMNGAAVTFAVTAGGGSVVGGSVKTGADGIARVTSWTLGTIVGVNTLTASSAGVQPVVFTATTTPGAPAIVAASAGDGQAAAVNTAVVTPPAAVVKDAFGNGVPGVQVTFTVTGGGGSVTDASQLTDATGVARVSAWRLGVVAGPNTLQASAAGATPATFTATATAGTAVEVIAVAGYAQSTPLSSIVAVPPSVRVRDQFGNPVPDATVTFAVTAGGGSLTDGVRKTNAQGFATVGSWRVGGAAGENTLTAQAVGAAPAVFTAKASANPVASTYALTIRYIAAATESQQRAVNRAAIRWQEIIVGDVADVNVFGVPANQCGDGSPAIDEVVDDLLIFIDFSSIDGAGKILGQAGPCGSRISNKLPAIGRLTLDDADLAMLETQGRMDDVILHEIGHVIGFGTIWKSVGALQFAGSDSVHFTGQRARDAFNTSGGNGFVGLTVPVENCVGINGCGGGTQDSHWRELVMGRELMTGFISASGQLNPLSEITIQSLGDVGYTVNTGAADTYIVSATKPIAGQQIQETPLVELPPDWTNRMLDDR